jgi:hypothetical protein
VHISTMSIFARQKSAAVAVRELASQETFGDTGRVRKRSKVPGAWNESANNAIIGCPMSNLRSS